jgi:AcrR family transcriptional regulator
MSTVDHDARRRRIAEITIDVIAREGLEAATIRRIAAELNGPTKLVTHYFSDKHELLVWVYQTLTELHRGNVDQAVAADPTDILDSLFALTPADEVGTKHWRVYLAFWDLATRDPAIAALQRAQINVTIQHISDIVRTRWGDRPDIESVSERFNAIVQGLAIQALMDRDRWPSERIRNRLAEEVDALLRLPVEF